MPSGVCRWCETATFDRNGPKHARDRNDHLLRAHNRVRAAHHASGRVCGDGASGCDDAQPCDANGESGENDGYDATNMIESRDIACEVQRSAYMFCAPPSGGCIV